MDMAGDAMQYVPETSANPTGVTGQERVLRAGSGRV